MRKKILFLIIFLAIFGIVSKASALETIWPPSPFGINLTDDSTLTDLVRYFYEWGIFIGGLAVFISLLIGGFLYLTSAGDPGRMKEAKDRIFSALTGLVLLFSIYLILNTINPELTVLTPPSFESTEVESPDVAELVKGTGKSCTYVRLYSDTYWKGNNIRINSEEDPDMLDVRGNFPGDGPKSARLFQACENNEICRDGKIIVVKDGAEYETTQICEESEITEVDGDCNVDCVVDDTDLDLYAAGDMRCDLNGDGVLDIDDFSIIEVNYGRTCAGLGCFKEGGACALELAPWAADWWGLVQYCAAKIGSTNSSNFNLRLLLEEEREIACVKVTKTGITQ